VTAPAPVQRTFRNAYTLVIMFVSFAVLALGGYFYTNARTEELQRASDRQWCDLLGSLAIPLDPNTNPPPTARSLKINGQIIDLHRRKCS
jgi:hypothetical protein